MKTKILILIVSYLLPVCAVAQPVVSKNEFYHIGDVIRMVNCNPGAGSGSAGANATWDFSGLIPSGGFSVTTVAANSSTDFITSNLVITLPNGFKEYMKENNTDSYVDGINDNAKNIVYNYYNLDIAKRPFTFNTTYLDTYRVIVTTTSSVGTGYLTKTGDGYGTLKLPTGTFSNVLRIKKTQIETDSVGGIESAFTTTVSYLWFDTLHTAPLYRIDSVNGIGGSQVTAMYLAAPTGIKDPIAGDDFRGFFDNDKLSVAGGFESGSAYHIAVYNIIGTKVFQEPFIAAGSTQQFVLNTRLRPGIYMIDISKDNEVGTRTILKLQKQ